MSALKIELLGQAKLRIETGQSGFICFALENLRKSLPGNDPAWDAVEELLEYVQRELGGDFDTLTEWLVWCYERRLTDDQATLCRMAWIDKMIYDLETA